jgi:hypothetical protein
VGLVRHHICVATLAQQTVIMPTTPTVHFNYEDSTVRSRLVYENGDSEQLALVRVGPDHWRLAESSFAGDAVYGDIIRVKEVDDETLLFIEITDRSNLITRSWVLSAEVLATERIQSILKCVMENGGMWEIAFGGLLMVHMPPDIAKPIFEQISPDRS